jgi:hypothetical protein
MPHLAKRMSSSEYKSFVQVPEVMGEVDVWRVMEQLSRTCGIEKMSAEAYLSTASKGKAAILQPTHLSNLGANVAQTLRAETLRGSDETLDAELSSVLANHTSHVIIFVSTPTEANKAHYQYDEPPYHAHMHTDLKRDVGEEGARIAEDKEKWSQEKLPLFEKYQFLTPGVLQRISSSI